MIASSQYNKRTQRAIGMYKAQLAKLKEREATKKGGAFADGFAVRKTGDGTVVLLGFPSVGKSTLLNGITDAESDVAAYAFTTLTVIPGMLIYKHAKIQILDVPGVVRGAASGRGRGTEVFSVLRSADLILMLIDVHHPEHYKVLLDEIYESGIRLNKRKPDVKIKKTAKDGIRIGATVKLTHLNDDIIKGILSAMRINNAEVVLRSDITDDELIDCIEANKKYVNSITILNKVDSVSKDVAERVAKQVGADLLISAQNKEHLDELKELIFDRLDLIRIYMKEPQKEADMKVPMIMFKGCTISDVCSKMHKDFVAKFKFCRIWGKSAKFPGQKLSIKHILKDGDVVELHLK